MRLDLAHEAEHRGGGRPVIDIVRRADLLDPALAHHHHAVGEFQRLFLVVGDEQRGVAGAVVQLAQPFAQFLAHQRVERAERLVEQQHLRLDGKRAGERHALALAARELRRETPAIALQLDQREQILDPLADLGVRRALSARPRAQAEGDVLGDIHVPEQRIILEHEADAAPAHRHGERIAAIEQHAPAARLLEPGNDAQQRRLAGAGRPEQRDQFARLDVERDVGERGGAGGAEALADGFDGDGDRHIFTLSRCD